MGKQNTKGWEDEKIGEEGKMLTVFDREVFFKGGLEIGRAPVEKRGRRTGRREKGGGKGDYLESKRISRAGYVGTGMPCKRSAWTKSRSGRVHDRSVGSSKCGKTRKEERKLSWRMVGAFKQKLAQNGGGSLGILLGERGCNRTSG